MNEQNLCKIIADVAALFYFEKPKQEPSEKNAQILHTIPFEILTKEEQTPYLREAAKFMLYLDKLNLVVRPRTEDDNPERQKELEARHFDHLVEIIKEFVGALKHPRGIAEMFPCEELAHRILGD